MEVIARSRYIRRGPRKARLVADLVRGMRVEEALTTLQFAPQHAAHDVAKTIKSAAANAEHNFELSRDELWLKTIMIDEGPSLKRIRPVSRGTAHGYVHRTCHITVIVEDREEEGGRRRRRQQQSARRAGAGASETSVDDEALAPSEATSPDEIEEETTTAATPGVEETEAAEPTVTEVEEPGETETADGDQVEAAVDEASSPDDEPPAEDKPAGKGGK